MSALVGSKGQQLAHPLFSADGSITTGGTAQLVLARAMSRTFFMFQNLSAGPMWIEFGSARATATVTSGVVVSVAVANAGLGFTYPPIIEFLGGGKAGNSVYLGVGQPGGASPSHPARAHCVMTGTAPNQSVSSIVVDDGGADYASAPYTYIRNSDLDPNGVALPSAGVGLLIASQSPPLIFNGTFCTTDQVSVYGDTTGQAFHCRYSD